MARSYKKLGKIDAIYLGNFLSYIILSKLCIKLGKIQAKICCQEFARSLRSARIRQDILLGWSVKKTKQTERLGIIQLLYFTCLIDTSFSCEFTTAMKMIQSNIF